MLSVRAAVSPRKWSRTARSSRASRNAVRAVGLGGLEAARDLVLAAGAALEDLHAAGDALVDRVVVADVEVQERVLLEAAPIAAVEMRRRGDVEGAGDELAVALGATTSSASGMRSKIRRRKPR